MSINMTWIAPKKTGLAIATAAMLSALVGCQGITGYQTLDTPVKPDLTPDKIQTFPGEVTVACEGTYHCEIVQMDKKLLINSDTHSPAKGAIVTQPGQLKQNKDGIKIPKLVPLLSTKAEGLVNYYARVMPGKHEIHTNFYPENNDEYVERFALIHDFRQPGDYRLRAYRLPMNDKADSLLDSASPNPLCVEVVHNTKPIRRFCKLPVDSRQNEFIEVTGLSSTAETQALLSSDDAVFGD